MAKGDFLWCDLSTFHLSETKAFYAGLFGWSYQTMTQPDGSPYFIADAGRRESAAIFEMPEKFQTIGLPSFWMSYIAVDDIEATVEQARTLGGKVELGPIPFGDSAMIALIRDPLGAGFTCYQGNELTARPERPAAGQMAWNALYVSDSSAVIPFYRALFDWTIETDPDEAGVFRVRNAAGKEISAIYELPDKIRGQYEFWGVHFAVADLAAAKAEIGRGGGTVLYEDANGPTLLAQDPDGAAFFLDEAKAARQGEAGPASGATSWRWKTIVALLVVWLAVVWELNWVWGILFVMWTIPALRTGQAFLVEPIGRSSNPILYWLIVGSWIGLSLFLVLYDLTAFLGFGT